MIKIIAQYMYSSIKLSNYMFTYSFLVQLY